jgi:hypothetical protein
VSFRLQRDQRSAALDETGVPHRAAFQFALSEIAVDTSA